MSSVEPAPFVSPEQTNQVPITPPIAPHPAATSLAGTLDKMHSAGLGGIDPSVLATVAQGATQSSMFPTTLKALADSVKNAAVPFLSVYHEAAQHVAPSVTHYVKTAINGTDNNLNSMQPSALDTQKQLQTLGYGVGLKADGVWSTGSGDNAWSQAFYTWQTDEMKKPGVGSTSAKGTFARIAHDVDPRYSLPGLWRSITSIIPATQKMVGETAGLLGNAMTAQSPILNNPYTITGGAREAFFAQHGRMPNDFEAMDQQKKMYGAPGDSMGGLTNLAGNAGTAINLYFLHGMAGSMAGTVARGAGEALTAGGGNLAKGMVSNLGREAAQRDTVNMMNMLVLKPLSGAAKLAAGLGKVGAMVTSPAEALTNLPNLKFIYPYIDTVRAAADGGWQSLRQNLRIPYQFPIVRTLAPLFPKAVFAGGVEQEMARADKNLGADNPLSMSMDHLTPIAGDWGKGLLASQFLLHSGYDEAGKISQFVGKGFSKLFDKVSNSVSDQALYSQWERGVGQSFAKTDQMFNDAGLPAGTLTNSIAQQAQEAAVHYAANIALDRANALAKAPLDTGEQLKLYQSEMNKIWDSAAQGDPTLLNQAQVNFSLVKNGFQAHLANSVNNAAIKEMISPSRGTVDFEKAKGLARTILQDAHNLETPASRNLPFAPQPGIKPTEPWGISTPIMSNEFAEPWATSNIPILHNFGIMKKTSLTSDELSAMVDKVMKSSTDEDTLHQKLVDIAFNKLGVSTATLIGKDSSQIEDFLHAQAPLLAANVYKASAVNENQVTAPWASSAMDELDKLGYKMVYGTHIGHAITDPIVPPPSVGIKEGLMSKALGNVGLGLTKTSDETYGQLRNSGMLTYLQKYFDNGAFTNFPPGYGPNETMQLLHNSIDKTLTPVERWFGKYGTLHVDNPAFKAVAKALSAGRFDEAITKMMGTDNINREEAKLRVQELLAQQKSSKDWTQKQVTDALTQPYLKDSKGILDEQLANSLGVRSDQPFTDLPSAIKFYRLMQEGSRQMPARLQGIGKFTDLLDNQFGLAGLPMGSNGYRLPNLTAQLKQKLLTFRYPVNLQFAWKRVVKTQLKGSTLGITPTANPGLAMKAAGTYENDMNLLRRLKPQEFSNNKNMDDALREAEQADLYNVFNPQEIQARTLGILQRRALDDPANRVDVTAPIFEGDSPSTWAQTGEKIVSTDLTPEAQSKVLKDLSSVYDYGPRTALERSANAIFFPFSFEKTVMRQLGMHLLDHQGQVLIGAAAIDFYDSHNGPAAKTWAEANLPAIKLLESFYPYNSSFGLGAFGGINKIMGDPFARAVLSMFTPKVVQGNQSAAMLKALVGAVPMFKEANQLFGGVDLSGKTPANPGGDFKTTADTSLWYMRSKLNAFLNHSAPGLLDPHPEQPYKVQINNGFNLESQLVSLYADELKANHNGASMVFPDKMPYVGRVGDLPPQKINMNSIKTIVASVYPQWNKNLGLLNTAIAADKTAELQREIAQTNPLLLPDYQWFVKNAQYVIKGLQDDTLKEGEVANYTQQLRSKALELAVLDTRFAAFYKKYYSTKFGPLEAIR